MTTTIDTQRMPTYDFDAIISGNIRAEAARIGINQRELARRTGINQGALSQRWIGKRAWKPNDIAKVAAVLGVTPWELVQPTQDKEKLPQLDSNQQPFD